MTGYLTSGVLAAMFALQSASAPATAPAPAKTAVKQAPKEMRLSGCIARDHGLPTDYTFLDNDSGGKFRLTGKGLKNFVGHRVEIVGGPPGKRVTFRTGLLPSTNTAAQAGAIDPAQAAIANLPGGAADDTGKAPLPEFHVVSLRGLDGGCQ
jgi:hypothetical protein